MFLNDIDRSTYVIFAANDIMFSFHNLMVNHGQSLPTIPRPLPSGWTYLEKSRFSEFTDGGSNPEDEH